MAMVMKKIYTTLLIMALLILCSCISLPAASNPHSATNIKQTPIQISSDALYIAYTNNQVAADTLYKGKLLDVTGSIGSITSDWIRLDVSDFDFIYCHLSNPDLNKLASLSKGQLVTIEGICTGSDTFNVDMTNCILITTITQDTNVVTTEVIEISSVDLIAAYMANSVAADQQYKNKVLQVSGPIEFIQDNVLMVRGVNSLDNIFLSFSAQNVTQLATLSRDDFVTVLGTCNGVNITGYVTFDNCSLVSSK